jgi:TatA/E family protein of Tat protein translocase
MGFLSPVHLLLLALVIALVFGARSVPTIARRAGKGIRETRDVLGIDEMRQEITGVRDTLRPVQTGDAGQPSTAAQPSDSTSPAGPGSTPKTGADSTSLS